MILTMNELRELKYDYNKIKYFWVMNSVFLLCKIQCEKRIHTVHIIFCASYQTKYLKFEP